MSYSSNEPENLITRLARLVPYINSYIDLLPLLKTRSMTEPFWFDPISRSVKNKLFQKVRLEPLVLSEPRLVQRAPSSVLEHEFLFASWCVTTSNVGRKNRSRYNPMFGKGSITVCD